MKKVISLLLALIMLMSLPSVAIAATEGQLTEGTNTIELPYDSKEASVFTYTATQTGTLYVAVIELYCDSGDGVYEENRLDECGYFTKLTINGQKLEKDYYGTVEVVAGETYTFSWEHVFSKWYQYGWEAVLYLSYTDDLTGSEAFPAELNREQCPTDSIEIAPGAVVNYTLYEFGGSTFTVTGENAYVLMTVNGVESSTEGAVRYDAEDGVVSVPIPYDYFSLQIGNDGDTAAVFGLNFYFPVGSAHNPQDLVIGENVAPTKKDDWDGYKFGFTAQCNGTLTLTFAETGWMCALRNVTAGGWDEWYEPYAGNVLTLEVSAGDEILISVISYRGMTVPGGDVAFQAAVSYNHNYENGVCTHCGGGENGEDAPELGSEERPVELYRENCPTETIEIPAGGSVWYVLYEFDYAQFLVIGENAYVNATVYNMDTEEQEVYNLLPVDGVVTLPVITWRVWVEIGNSGTEPAVFQLDYRYPEGCKKNPAELNMGENVANAKRDDYEGYIFEWVAQCDGQLTLTMPENDWTLIVYNMTNEEDGDWYDSSTGENTIIVDVKKGEEFWLSVLNYDETTGTFLDGEVKFTASVAYDHDYVDGVCTHCGGEEVLYELGDVNGDGRINVRDARTILRYIAGLIGENELALDAADFNGDTRVNVRDARAILNYIAGVG